MQMQVVDLWIWLKKKWDAQYPVTAKNLMSNARKLKKEFDQKCKETHERRVHAKTREKYE